MPAKQCRLLVNNARWSLHLFVMSAPSVSRRWTTWWCPLRHASNIGVLPSTSLSFVSWLLASTSDSTQSTLSFLTQQTISYLLPVTTYLSPFYQPSSSWTWVSEPGSVYFLHLIQNKISGDKWHRFLLYGGILSSCVCPCVCLSIACCYCMKTTAQIQLGYCTELIPFTYPALCYKKIRVFPKIRFLLELCPKL